VESTIRLGSTLGYSDFFSVTTGVRQGCILSPLLYSIWINDLAIRIKERCAGVAVDRIGARRLHLLMYADDIVLLAETPAELQAMMSQVDEYARLWRFQVNPSKCAAMYFAPRPSSANPSVTLHMGGGNIEWVDQYKYLGVELQRSGRPFTLYRTRAERSARCALGQVSAMGMYSGKLPVPIGCQVYTALVRSQMEYAAEIWSSDSSWDAAERVQLLAARRILRCPTRTHSDAVRSELALESMEFRWLLLRLGFWLKLQLMPDTDWPRRILEETMREYAHTDAAGVPVIAADSSEGWTIVRANNMRASVTPPFWCAQLQLDLYHTGLSELWCQSGLLVHDLDEWQTKIRTHVHRREAAQWWRTVQQHSSLETYVSIRQQQHLPSPLVRPTYFDVPHGGWNDRHLIGRQLVTQLRLGVNNLRISTGRITGEHRAHRFCICCTQDIETEQHFLLECCFYDDLRTQLFHSINTLIDPSDFVHSDSSSNAGARFDIVTLPKLDQLKLILSERIAVLRRCHQRVLLTLQTRVLEQLPAWFDRRNAFIALAQIDTSDTNTEKIPSVHVDASVHTDTNTTDTVSQC
jgi:hypothetical protein